MSGFDFLSIVKIFSRFVSVSTKQLPCVSPSLSLLILICSLLSSPETYKLFSISRARVICSISVDFPIPGSPPIKTTEPGTIPPPKTLFSSLSLVIILAILEEAIFLILIGRSFCKSLSDHKTVSVCLFVLFSSINEFHSLHPGHFPNHLGDV